jgi:diketogulonate reductase-like aldo/keto reductase
MTKASGKTIAMGRRRLGPQGAMVPIVGQGTWQMGAARDRADEVAALCAGIDEGMTHLDTAEMYGDGAAEEMIADALDRCGRRRDELFIVSKVLPGNATFAGTISACERSLRRLRTDYLDLYLLHWRGAHPLRDTMAAMESLVKAGKIRALGVSNFSTEDIDEAARALTRERIACNQVLYHLGQRHIDAGLVDDCAARDIAVVGYSPFGHGRFPGPSTRGGRALGAVAERHGATPRQVALAFLARAAPLFTIPKAGSVEHARENAGALRLQLDEEDIQAIDAAFPARAERELPTA